MRHPIPAEQLKNFIGQPIYVSWADRGRWTLEAIEDDMAFVGAYGWGKSRWVRVSELRCNQQQHEHPPFSSKKRYFSQL